MNQTMKAVVFEGKGRFALKERPVPALHAPTDAIVRVTLASICSSDLHIKHGSVPVRSPELSGHEMVGVVEQIGNGVRKVRAGDRVTVNVETFCGECYFAAAGLSITVRTNMAAGPLAAGSTAGRQSMSACLLPIMGSM